MKLRSGICIRIFMIITIGLILKGCLLLESISPSEEVLNQEEIAIDVESKNEPRHCIAIAHSRDQQDEPLKCFSDISSLQHHSSVALSGYAILLKLYVDKDFQGNSLWIYGLACNAYGELNSLGWMNNKASSLKAPCHGQVSGYYWTCLCANQSCSPINWAIDGCYSQVNDGDVSNLLWPANDQWEAFRNQANKM